MNLSTIEVLLIGLRIKERYLAKLNPQFFWLRVWAWVPPAPAPLENAYSMKITKSSNTECVSTLFYHTHEKVIANWMSFRDDGAIALYLEVDCKLIIGFSAWRREFTGYCCMCEDEELVYDVTAPCKWLHEETQQKYIICNKCNERLL